MTPQAAIQLAGGGFEFTSQPGDALLERSTLFNSPFFTPEAVSPQDYVALFSDENLLVPGTSIPISDHIQPLNLEVVMESYNWNHTHPKVFEK